MEDAFTSEVTTSAEGLTTVQIVDTTSQRPTLYLTEHAADGQVVWLGSESCAVSLCREQVYEVLSFLLTFLQTGRLVIS